METLETRVYGINMNAYDGTTSTENLTDEQFMGLAEGDCLVWTLNNFARQFNMDDINQDTMSIRFIEIVHTH